MGRYRLWEYYEKHGWLTQGVRYDRHELVRLVRGLHRYHNHGRLGWSGITDSDVTEFTKDELIRFDNYTCPPEKPTRSIIP